MLREGFGLELVKAPSVPGELWHPTVQKCLLRRLGGGKKTEGGKKTLGEKKALGVLYLDLYGRAGKTRGAALYTLRGASAVLSADLPHTPPDLPHTSPDLHLDLPAAALVCSSGDALSHPQLVALFHEMGHALHALLGRTTFQHFSGVRVPLDFVEVPSTLFERFALSPPLLSKWATHEGEPLPLALAETICAKRFPAIAFQRQAIAALLDLELHGETPPATADEVRAIAARLAARHGALDGPIPTAIFSHLGGYGAGYYSYLWAREISSQIWDSHFEPSPLCRSKGESWIRALSHYNETGEFVYPLSLAIDTFDSNQHGGK